MKKKEGCSVVEPTEYEEENMKEAGGMWMTRLMPVAVNLNSKRFELRQTDPAPQE